MTIKGDVACQFRSNKTPQHSVTEAKFLCDACHPQPLPSRVSATQITELVMPPLNRIAHIVLLLAGLLGGAHAALAQRTPPAELSIADRARALADARPWAGMALVGSSVADGKLRDIMVAPWTGTWGDDTLAGGAVSYRLARFWKFFMLDAELGGAYRFGDTEGGEFWAAAYLRYDGFPWTNHVYTTFGLSMGPDYVTRLPRVERGTDAQPEANQSRFLNFFSPELTFALPERPHQEVVLRYMHRSGIFGTFNGVWEGANSLTVGFRMRF